MNIAICDDDLLYMNQVKEMIEKWGKEHHEDVSIYLFNHGDALINSYQKSHIRHLHNLVTARYLRCW